MTLLSLTIVKNKVSKLNESGKVVVFTNGCFDIIHKGHITLLKKARQLGDFLIVGLNSNESVSNLKGQDRPINSEEKRSANLLKLDYVDGVVIFYENTNFFLFVSCRVDQQKLNQTFCSESFLIFLTNSHLQFYLKI